MRSSDGPQYVTEDVLKDAVVLIKRCLPPVAVGARGQTRPQRPDLALAPPSPRVGDRFDPAPAATKRTLGRPAA